MSMGPNPYAASPTPGGMGGPDPGYALGRVNGPAMSMMVIAGISIAVRVVMLVLGLMGAGVVAAGAAGNDADAGAAAAQAVGGLFGNVLGIALNAVIVFGALKMKNLQSYGLAMTAAVLSVIPCCSPCVVLGIPFGIWALIVLNDPQVKASFR